MLESRPADRTPPSLDALDRDEVETRLLALTNGDRDAAAWLYDQFAGDLRRRLTGRYGGMPGIDPDDLLQDAFVFYFQNRAKVLRDFLDRVPSRQRSAQRLARHLWDLACGLATNRRRAAKVRAGTDGFAEGDEERLMASISVEDEVLDRDQLRRLDQCITGHGTRVALYYRLRCFDGHTPRDIAEIAGWSMKVTYKLRQALNDAVRACAERLGLDPEAYS
ncbi:MAG: hypothetical protein AAGE94_22060 [Acidobacteriota bacterium]